MSSIHEAASRGDLEELSRLLSQDPGLVHHRDRRFHDCTPLCQAVIRGQLQAVQLLIDHGADVNAGVTRRGGGTVLVQACAHGNRDVALLLLARGADPVKDDSSRAGALKAAAYGGDEEIVRALLRSGVCDVDGCSGNGRSALWKACCHGHQGAARALLTEGTHARTEREGRAGPGREAHSLAAVRGVGGVRRRGPWRVRQGRQDAQGHRHRKGTPRMRTAAAGQGPVSQKGTRTDRQTGHDRCACHASLLAAAGCMVGVDGHPDGPPSS